MTVESDPEMPPDNAATAAQPKPPQRTREQPRRSLRLALIVAALFAVLAVLGGGTGLVLGGLAAPGGEHGYEHQPPNLDHHDDGDGVPPGGSHQ